MVSILSYPFFHFLFTLTRNFCPSPLWMPAAVISMIRCYNHASDNPVQRPFLFFFFVFFWAGPCDPIACTLLGGGIPGQIRGYKITRICPSSMLSCYFLPPSSFLACRRFLGNSLLLAYCLLSVRFRRCPLLCPLQI